MRNASWELAVVRDVVQPDIQTEVVFIFNSLPNDKILDWSKIKAYADDKINVTEKLNFVLGRVSNIVGKGENAGY